MLCSSGNDPGLLSMPVIELLDILTINCSIVATESSQSRLAESQQRNGATLARQRIPNYFISRSKGKI